MKNVQVAILTLLESLYNLASDGIKIFLKFCKYKEQLALKAWVSFFPNHTVYQQHNIRDRDEIYGWYGKNVWNSFVMISWKNEWKEIEKHKKKIYDL